MKKILIILSMICTILANRVFSNAWYVRPAGGSYGLENGTSYQNAWDGLVNVKWGTGGVQPGDTLYICGLHVWIMTDRLHNFDSQADIGPLISGTSQNRVMIRGDYPGDMGTVWASYRISYSAWRSEGDNTYSVDVGPVYQDFYFQGITANSWTLLTPVGSVAQCKTTAGSCYSGTDNRLYIHCTDNGDPTDRIYAPNHGYNFLINGKQYITFLNLKFYAAEYMFPSRIHFPNAYYSNVRFEKCVFWYGSPLFFGNGYHHIEVIGCNVAWAMGGIDMANGATDCTFSGNIIHDIGVRASTQNSDAHGIGIQGAHNTLIEKNEIYNCGSGITFFNWTTQTCTSNIVRWNYVHDTHTVGGANSRGIEHNTETNDVDTHGNEIYGNIVANCQDAGYRFRYKDLGKFYNNIAYNCGTSFYFHRQTGTTYGMKIEFKNNISLNPRSLHLYFQDLAHEAGTGDTNCRLDSDYNLFYPISGSQFVFNHKSSTTTTTLTGWKALSKPGCIFDPHSLGQDPKLINTSGRYSNSTDFQLQSSSPAIDAGVDVGLAQDRAGVAIPQGSAPDIGAYEYVFGSNPLLATLNASPSSGYAPLAVSFSGSATGGTPPYTYRWSFGDGGSSTVQNPSHTYSSPGSFTATLTVTDSQSATNSKSLTINVTSAANPLLASASASPSSGQAPLAVNFNGSATGGTPPYTYRWNFGDGQSSTSQNASHTYSASGNYAAILTVTDSQSATATNSVSINVTATPGQLLATASGSPTSGLAPLAVSFTGSATGGTPPYTYNWNFGDGSSSSAQNPSHTYSTIGNYTANLTVTDSGSANASATVSIAVGSVTAASLALAAVTGAPAPGQGGTTDPSPGNHSFSIGSSASVRSISNTDYRFSKWTGDVTQAATFNLATTLTMDKNKSLSATFCTKCADVNGDLNITPADAQRAFDIYLGKIANPTWCELENADVNCSGTKSAPKVTPADAQAIFHKYLKKGVVTSDCSGNSRVPALGIQSSGFSNVSLTISNVTFAPGQYVVIPVIVESPSDIKAFGFDLSYPSDILTYIGLESTELTNDFDQLDANVLAFQEINQERPKTEPEKDFIFGFGPVFATKILTLQAINRSIPSQEFDPPSTGTGNYRLLRVGGYKTESTANPTSGVLVTLIFRVIGEAKDPGSISVIATYDDIKNASIKNNGMINRQNSPQVREDEKPVRKVERKIPGKRYDF